MKKENNIAFVDGQNLHLGTMLNNWRVDLWKFKVYLKDKYHVTEAYYFLGYVSDDEKDLYDNLQKSGFTLCFKEHLSLLKGSKKGNVDTDIVFEIMKNLMDNKDFDKIVLVSGDGDYKKVVDYLIKKDKFRKVLFPNRKFASSLYKTLDLSFYDNLDNPDIKAKIEYLQKKKRAP
ncbi:MAG: NYN domain-containing protein [Candidatus Paceibacterota bacterium]